MSVPPKGRSSLTGPGLDGPVTAVLREERVWVPVTGGTVRPTTWEVVPAALTPPPPGSPVSKEEEGTRGRWSGGSVWRHPRPPRTQ